jgi:cytochrome c-type biogenesis protein CcmH/NrfF
MRKHSLDPFSLIFGTTFTVLGLMFLLTRVDLGSLHLQWVWPIPIIVLGVMIIALAARGRPGDRGEPLEDHEPPSLQE